MITIYQPDVQVWLYKTIQRKTTNGKDAVSQRFQGSADRMKIDLRPYLGDGAGVQASKNVREAAGGFQVTLVDKPDGNDGSYESLYGLIEPMDMIEIRARHGTPTDPTQAPIIMRGFVTQVSRQEAIGGDGRPQRSVVISGQDYGKIWQIIQISYHAGYLVGQQFISGFTLFEQYGVGNKTVQSSADFVAQVVTNIINPFLDKMMPTNSPMPRALFTDVTVTEGTVSPAIQTQQGSIYELLRYFGDVGPWNELFVEDRDDGVYMVYRPNPYLNATTGELIQDDAPDPVYVDVPAVDVMSMGVSRSDMDVANYYWVNAPRFNLVNQAYQKQEASASGDDTVILADYDNANVKLYGIRMMDLQTQQGATDSTSQSTGAPAAEIQKGQLDQVAWMADRRRIVSESNKDNILFERGTIRMRGNEQLKAGAYLRLQRGDTTAIYYIIQVEHSYEPFQGFFSTVQVERGTGFIERIQNENSPYMAELTDLK